MTAQLFFRNEKHFLAKNLLKISTHFTLLFIENILKELSVLKLLLLLYSIVLVIIRLRNRIFTFYIFFLYV